MVILNSRKVFFHYLLDKLILQPVQIRVSGKGKGTIEEKKNLCIHGYNYCQSVYKLWNLTSGCKAWLFQVQVSQACLFSVTKMKWPCSVALRRCVVQVSEDTQLPFFVSGICRSLFQWSFVQTLLLQLDPIWEADETSQPWMSACFLQDFTNWILSYSPLTMKALDKETMEICFMFQSVILQ